MKEGGRGRMVHELPRWQGEVFRQEMDAQHQLQPGSCTDGCEEDEPLNLIST